MAPQSPSRRQFIITTAIAVGAGMFASHLISSQESASKIITVTGPIDPEQMGFALPHEHIMSIFGGPIARHAEYDEEKLITTVVPYLKKLKNFGAQAICDCTAAYFGRRPDLLRRIAEETGLQILTNTGYYGAANDRYVPDHAHTETADQLALRWIAEHKNGIDGTDIHPGFIKIGVDGGPLSELDAKLIRAAARTHLDTGLVIAAHTSGSVEAGMDQLRILKEEGVHPSAWIWVHAHKVQDSDALLKAADQGAWIELDGIQENAIDQHLRQVAQLKAHGHLNQILLSHDGNSFRYGDRPFKPYDSIFTHFVPKLKSSGYTENEIHELTAVNPAQAFTIHIRKA